jgi:hypothetical protein
MKFVFSIQLFTVFLFIVIKLFGIQYFREKYQRKKNQASEYIKVKTNAKANPNDMKAIC